MSGKSVFLEQVPLLLNGFLLLLIIVLVFPSSGLKHQLALFWMFLYIFFLLLLYLLKLSLEF